MTAAVLSRWAVRVSDATPRHRDRTVDALRAAGILGVVVGHWLVTALVADPARPGSLHSESPLSNLPQLAPVTWLLQTLGLFFFAGGYAAARSIRGRGWLPWLASRLVRLVRPVLVLAAVWVPAWLLLWASEAPPDTRHAVWSIVGHPLWFLAVYVALTALTPVAQAVVRRVGPWAVLPAGAVVAVADVSRAGGLPTWLYLVDVLAGWLVPYLLGIAVAQQRLAGRRAGVGLLAAGVVGGAALIGLAGYPASAVGVPGDGWSNLSPPSMLVVALAVAQIGGYLLLRERLALWLRPPRRWAPVAALNLVALTVFCWHQSALLLVTFVGLLGGLPGVVSTPDGAWLAYRLVWLPVFAVVLVGLVALFHRAERSAGGPDRHGAGVGRWRQVAGRLREPGLPRHGRRRRRETV